MAELKTLSTIDTSPFKRLVLQLGGTPSAFSEGVTYYELLGYLVKFLEDEVVPKTNDNIEAVKELQEYVSTYFDNLDVQEEINNKLDQMAESGELANIIAIYLESNAIISFSNVADLKNAENLVNGSFVKTYGYYNVGDGGAAFYKIREVTNQDTTNDKNLIALNNFSNLVAEIVINETYVVVNQFGAYGDNTHDDTTAIQACIDFCTPRRLTTKLLNKRYITSSPLNLYECTAITGGEFNDEYDHNATIINTSSNMISIASNTVGIHISNICFKGDETTDYYFINDTTNAFEWCEFSHIGIRNYKKAFDALILGCRFDKIWINHVCSAGRFRGSDNTFTDWWIGTPLASESYDALVLNSVSLSRFTNLYFTGKTEIGNGCRNILNIAGGYCTNLVFNGCYFDFSNGGAINISGQGNNWPTSGATNISFNNCLFRGNCCSTANLYHVINTEYVRDINFCGCSFDTQTRYTENSNSKIYNLGDFSQGVNLINNYYHKDFSTTNNTIYTSGALIESRIGKFNNGVRYYNGALQFYARPSATNSDNQFKAIQAFEYQGTTGATYGELTIPFGRTYNNTPLVIVQNKNNSGFITCLNAVTNSNVQVILRQASNGGAVTNTTQTFNVLVISKDGDWESL